MTPTVSEPEHQVTIETFHDFDGDGERETLTITREGETFTPDTDFIGEMVMRIGPAGQSEMDLEMVRIAPAAYEALTTHDDGLPADLAEGVYGIWYTDLDQDGIDDIMIMDFMAERPKLTLFASTKALSRDEQMHRAQQQGDDDAYFSAEYRQTLFEDGRIETREPYEVVRAPDTEDQPGDRIVRF